jgi:hypothetical protein
MIEIKNLPEWVNPKKTLMLISGKELVAFKQANRPWKIKEQRCNQCGECCLDFPPAPFGHDDEGKCNMLQKQGDKWECRAGANTPKRCLADPDEKAFEDLGCSIRYF